MSVSICKSNYSYSDIDLLYEDVYIKDDIKKIEYGKLENISVAYEENKTDVIQYTQQKPETELKIFE